MTDAKLEGRHVALIFVSGFSVIIAVNLLLAFSAVRTFPGLEVKNSYVASQSFDADRAAQKALGWTIDAGVQDAVLRLAITNANGPVNPDITRATFGRATHTGDDRELEFTFDGTALVAATPGLAPGNWNLRLVAIAEDGTEFRQRIVLRVAQ